MKYEIHIGTAFDIDKKMQVPKQTIIITHNQLEIIEAFANTKKDCDMNTSYIINEIEFKVYPHFEEVKP